MRMAEVVTVGGAEKELRIELGEEGTAACEAGGESREEGTAA